MSSKSTILLTPSCHIYYDYAHNHGDTVYADKDCEVLVVEVSYGNVEMYGEEHLSNGNNTIIALADSDFANIVVWMCEEWKKSHDNVESIDIDSQPEDLKSIIKAMNKSGNEVTFVNGILTIRPI